MRYLKILGLFFILIFSQLGLAFDDQEALAIQNQQDGEAYLMKNKENPKVETTKSGLQYQVLKKGDGKDHPKLSDEVTVEYEGRLLNGNVFDSSYSRGQSATFPVNGVIMGWQEALQMMKPGDEWEVTIPAELAYGARGVPGVIGPNEVLIFKVHLISIN